MQVLLLSREGKDPPTKIQNKRVYRLGIFHPEINKINHVVRVNPPGMYLVCLLSFIYYFCFIDPN